MTNAITNSLVQTSVPVDRGQSTQPPAAASKVSQPTTPSADAQGAYTVHISDAAKQALQAMMKEATENTYQTAQEASHGDIQAQRLLAKEAAAKKLT